jgi:hypothetical protein
MQDKKQTTAKNKKVQWMPISSQRLVNHFIWTKLLSLAQTLVKAETVPLNWN